MQEREFSSTARLALLVGQCERLLVVTPGCPSFNEVDNCKKWVIRLVPQGALREHDGQRQSLHLFEAGEVDGLEDISMITIGKKSIDQNIAIMTTIIINIYLYIFTEGYIYI